ncbi:ABC transporter permease [Sphingomonas sp. LaA6.9]|uniref:MlaE family ABC transporter permease n=1 Tax=Sphingomonas sp. LaA6.9 TaxID=2919914 RepID=UPI001F503054|nr:ABC transporter permease [Sphingomonas sp. LaA6.9]MCJ8156527.1 ABC transporter permease [Sphingomonas sp. LaA6.9]
MEARADFIEEQGDSGRMLRFTGNLAIARLGDLPQRLKQLSGPFDEVRLDQIEHIDTIGAWIVHDFAQTHSARITGADGDARKLLERLAEVDDTIRSRTQPDYTPAFLRVLGEVGDATMVAGRTLLGLLGFFGATCIAIWNVMRHPSRIRVNAVVQRFEVVGVSALGIVGLMSFLIGIVIAQQGAVQLRQFGAEVFTINLIGRITLRELGVLMTAIMVAGRSGSAFAAQLGTMKLTEEIDAMRIIGVSPMEALVLPRLFASVVMMPLLGFYASVVAIIGGGIWCWIDLGIPPVTFVQRLREVVPMTDLWVGIVKAPVFGAIIAMAGCFQGMQVKADAEEVGMRTTSAVVQAIFLVIVLDAFFAVFFTQVGWI